VLGKDIQFLFQNFDQIIAGYFEFLNPHTSYQRFSVLALSFEFCKFALEREIIRFQI
jgi:hypothetical protein